MSEHQTIKIWRSTYLKLKRLAGQKPEKLVDLIDRLVDEEIQRSVPNVATNVAGTPKDTPSAAS